MRRRDFISTLAGDALLERLEPIVVDAKTVLDLGAGKSPNRRALKRRFRGARIIRYDVSDRQCEIAFDDGAVDIVIANLLLPRIGNMQGLFTEIARVLREGGLFAFSTFGPDTLPALRFPDMHDVGDTVMRTGFRNPVLDVDRSTLSYENRDVLARDLDDLGLLDAANSLASPVSLELELVYGHCWGAGAASRDGAVRIDPAHITRR